MLFIFFFSIGAIHQAMIFKRAGDLKHRRAHVILWMGVAGWPWWVWEKRRCLIHLANILDRYLFLHVLHITGHLTGSVLRASALLVLIEWENGGTGLLLQNVKRLSIKLLSIWLNHHILVGPKIWLNVCEKVRKQINTNKATDWRPWSLWFVAFLMITCEEWTKNRVEISVLFYLWQVSLGWCVGICV